MSPGHKKAVREVLAKHGIVAPRASFVANLAKLSKDAERRAYGRAKAILQDNRERPDTVIARLVELEAGDHVHHPMCLADVDADEGCTCSAYEARS